MKTVYCAIAALVCGTVAHGASAAYAPEHESRFNLVSLQQEVPGTLRVLFPTLLQDEGTPPILLAFHRQDEGTPPNLIASDRQVEGTPPTLLAFHQQDEGTPRNLGA